MKIILLDKIDNLGNIGDEVNVKSGYARNFLIPNSQAVLANTKNIELFKMRRVLLEDNLRKIRSEAASCISKIKEIGSVSIISKSGVSGKLFGSIGSREIADAIVKLGVNVSRYNVYLPHGRLKYLGDHCVVIKIHREISTTLNICIVDGE